MKTISDKNGRTVAYFNDVNPYRQEIRGRSNELLGYYDPHLNKTFDRSGGLVGTGDQRGKFISDH